jgi:hypothetical protein
MKTNTDGLYLYILRLKRMRVVIYSIHSYGDSVSVSLEVVTVDSECLKLGSFL